MEFKLVSQLSKPALGRTYNQDCVGISKTAIWILDGTSEVTPQLQLKNGKNAVAFFVEQISDYLSKNIEDTNKTIPDILIEAMTFVVTKIESVLFNTVDWKEISTMSLPSASIAIARIIDENQLEIYSLGDCVIFIDGTKDKIIQNEALMKIETDLIREVYKQRKEFPNLNHQDYLNKINVKKIDQQCRINMIENDQFNVLNFDTSKIESGTQYNTEIDSNTKLLLMTDGFSRIIENYHLYKSYHQLLQVIEKQGGGNHLQLIEKDRKTGF